MVAAAEAVGSSSAEAAAFLELAVVVAVEVVAAVEAVEAKAEEKEVGGIQKADGKYERQRKQHVY